MRLALSVPAPGATFVNLKLQLTQWNLQLMYRWGCCGEDLVRFADSLERLHAALEGKAMFRDCDQVVELTFMIADRTRGRTSIDVRIDHGFDDRGFQNPIPFHGFELQQSYVAGIVRDIRRFLSDYEIYTSSPRDW